MTQQTNRVTVEWDGNIITADPGASIDLGGVTREGSMSDQGSFHYQVSENVGTVTVTAKHLADADIAAIRAATDVTVTFNTDTGLTYAMGPSVLASVGAISEGTYELTFIGPPATRL
ncbi:MAG: phage tail tube protein [Myxococcota bacterium]